MPLYIGDYLRDTRHLTTIQHGAYLLLLMEYWTKGRIPKEDRDLRRIVGMDDQQWRRNKSALRNLFGVDWSHARVERELRKAEEISLKRQVYGAKGGRISRRRNNLERFVVVNGGEREGS